MKTKHKHYRVDERTWGYRGHNIERAQAGGYFLLCDDYRTVYAAATTLREIKRIIDRRDKKEGVE